AKLCEPFLGGYGPATMKGLLRWWGVSEQTTMKPILASLGDAVTEGDVDGVRAYARSGDVDSIEPTQHLRRWVHLVGGFDPLIVGAGLREQLIPAAHMK